MISFVRLKLARITAKLKQHEVAAKLRVSTNYVSMIERGVRQPSLSYLQSFAQLVDLPISFLFPATNQKEIHDGNVDGHIGGIVIQNVLDQNIEKTYGLKLSKQIRIKDDAYAVLKKISLKYGRSYSEFASTAIEVLDYVMEEIEAGGIIFVQDKNLNQKPAQLPILKKHSKVSPSYLIAFNMGDTSNYYFIPKESITKDLEKKILSANQNNGSELWDSRSYTDWEKDCITQIEKYSIPANTVLIVTKW